MDQRNALFTHERKLGGLCSELRIESPEGESSGVTVKSLSLWNVLSLLGDGAFEQEFFHWVAESANDVTWVSWVRQKWQAVPRGLVEDEVL
jgi:hypothetical protein